MSDPGGAPVGHIPTAKESLKPQPKNPRIQRILKAKTFQTIGLRGGGVLCLWGWGCFCFLYRGLIIILPDFVFPFILELLYALWGIGIKKYGKLLRTLL